MGSEHKAQSFMFAYPILNDVDKASAHDEVQVQLCLVDQDDSGAGHMASNPNDELHQLPFSTTELIEAMPCPTFDFDGY